MRSSPVEDVTTRGMSATRATLKSRTEHLDELLRIVADALASGTTEEWFERLRDEQIPAVPYNRVDDLFDDEHLAAVGFWETMEHPTEGTLLQFRLPITLDGERPPLGVPAPRLGADTEAVPGSCHTKSKSLPPPAPWEYTERCWSLPLVYPFQTYPGGK